MSRRAGDRGQASVELLAVLPLLAALVAGCAQLVLMGESWWLAGVGARAGARAERAGGDAARAARAALPQGWGRRLHVAQAQGGGLAVRLRVPAVVGGAAIGTVSQDVGGQGGS